MRAFVIADASKRKAKPIGMLFWEASPTDDQGQFAIEISAACSEGDLPLSLSFCITRTARRATAEESREWVKSRIVPENRQNIASVLMANGLSRYSEIDLLATCQGRSSDDDFLVYEVELEERQASATVDNLLAHIERRRSGREIRYAYIDLSPADRNDDAPTVCTQRAQLFSHGETAAHRIGKAIRAQRIEAGLTQKQLAAQAGITQAVLSRVESGKGNPTLALLEELACALGCAIEVSLGLSGCKQ